MRARRRSSIIAHPIGQYPQDVVWEFCVVKEGGFLLTWVEVGPNCGWNSPNAGRVGSKFAGTRSNLVTCGRTA